MPTTLEAFNKHAGTRLNVEVASLASAFAYSSFHDDLPGRSRGVRYNPDLWLLIIPICGSCLNSVRL
jgi:hypothetical protein